MSILAGSVKYVEFKFVLNQISFLIEKQAIGKMNSYKQHYGNMAESGGLLLGRTDINGNTRILDVTTPLDKDVKRRCFFKRRDEGHIKLLQMANERCLYFKGNWHTHPQTDPTPSYLDKRSWKVAIKKSKPGESSHIFFLIIGTDRFRVWAGNMKTKEVKEMELQTNAPNT